MELQRSLDTPTPTGLKRAFLIEGLPIGSLFYGLHYIAAKKFKFVADRRLAFYGTLAGGVSTLCTMR